MTESETQTQVGGFNFTAAARFLGVSRVSLWRMIKRREIYPVKGYRLIPLEELLRFMREGSAASKRTKRFPRIITKNDNTTCQHNT